MTCPSRAPSCGSWWPSSDRLFVDSSNFRDTGLERMIGMARILRGGIVVHDIAWMRLRALAGAVRGAVRPSAAPAGAAHHQRPCASTSRARAASVRLNRAAAVRGLDRGDARLEGRDGRWSWARTASITASSGSGKREIPVEIRPVSAPIDGPLRTAGSLVRAEVEAGRARSALRVRVTRQSDHLLGTADWNGAQVARRAARQEVVRGDALPGGGARSHRPRPGVRGGPRSCRQADRRAGAQPSQPAGARGADR